ncbi:MAG: hypothetical protein J0H99_00485, partial [Rhodospirillales bacterium]|nr:hypothetical protein [Rhodospirillales bacterium]
FYQVQAVPQPGRPPLCRLRLELQIDHRATALILSQAPGGGLWVQFLAQNPEILSADLLRIGLDGQEVFHVTPSRRDKAPELSGITGEIAEAAKAKDAIDDLRERAQGAAWLQIVALPYNKRVPADGLRQAMDDWMACRITQQG